MRPPGGQSYEQVVVGPDTAAAAVDLLFAQTNISQTVDELKLDIKTTISEFTVQFTADIENRSSANTAKKLKE